MRAREVLEAEEAAKVLRAEQLEAAQAARTQAAADAAQAHGPPMATRERQRDRYLEIAREWECKQARLQRTAATVAAARRNIALYESAKLVIDPVVDVVKIVVVVMLSKLWDQWCGRFVWTSAFGKPPGAALNCGQNFVAFAGTVCFGAMALALLLRRPDLPCGIDKLLPATVAMQAGWAFKTALAACHDEQESLVIDSLTLVADEEQLIAWDVVNFETRDLTGHRACV